MSHKLYGLDLMDTFLMQNMHIILIIGNLCCLLLTWFVLINSQKWLTIWVALFTTFFQNSHQTFEFSKASTNIIKKHERKNSLNKEIKFCIINT